MDGAGKLKQHDNVHKQITAFEKLLQHAMSRFSKEKLYQMLRVVQKGLAALPQATQESHDPRPASIQCMSQLRVLIDAFKSDRLQGLQKEEENHLINYFETFFDDLRYLKDLKKHFDERIYCCLYDYFYDPTDDINGAFDIDFSGKKALIILEDEKDSGHSSLPGSDDEQTLRGRRVTFRSPDGKHAEPGVKMDHMNDKEKLAYAVREMFTLNQNWDSLFIEDTIDPDSFEVDSHYELLEFPRCDQFENVFRLVPDVFVKAFKSAELAKLWWTQANKIYPHAPLEGKRNSSKEFGKKVESLERNIKDLKYDIIHDEGKLKEEMLQLKRLQNRESRYNVLSAKCERIEELKNATSKKYNDLFNDRTDLKSEMNNLLPGSSKYKRMEKIIHGLDQQLIATNDKLKLISYHFDILDGDFNLELVVRPDIIRFLCDAELRVQKLEDSLIIKRQIKRQAEKKLALLKTNCERMRTIMMKYIQSANQNREKRTVDQDTRKRYRRRPTSGERAARLKSQERKQEDKGVHPDYLKPRRDATFVTSQASDQDSMEDREASPRYFDSLEVERIPLLHQTSRENKESVEKERPKEMNYHQNTGRGRSTKRRSRSLGKTFERGRHESPGRERTIKNHYDYDSDISERRSEHNTDESLLRTAQRARRRNKDPT